MPLTVNLRHLEADELSLEGDLPVEELDLDLRDELVRAEKPLHYDLEVQQMEQSLLLQGELELTLRCQCVRCLKAFDYQLVLQPWSRLLPLEGEDKVPVINDSVDLTPMIREDILLEIPQHPLCDADCGGLPKNVLGKAKNTTAQKTDEESSSTWAELDKLKF